MRPKWQVPFLFTGQFILSGKKQKKTKYPPTTLNLPNHRNVCTPCSGYKLVSCELRSMQTQTVHLIVWIWHYFSCEGLEWVLITCKGILGTRRPKMKALLPAETQELQGPWTLAELSSFSFVPSRRPKLSRRKWYSVQDSSSKSNVKLKVTP